MDAAEIAKRIDAIESGVAANASRVADLEARVSFLEAENTRLRKAMPNGQAMDHTGKRGPTFGRLVEDLSGNKQNLLDIAGGHMVNDVTEASDSEKEGMNVNVTSGRSAEEGALPVPAHWDCEVLVAIDDCRSEDEIEDLGGYSGRDHGRTIHCDDTVGLEDDDDDVSIIPRGRKRLAARMITSDRGSEDEIDHAAGGGGSDHENIHCDDNVDLEDDDVSIIPRGRKRIAARMITSDSEDEDMNVKDGKVQEEFGATPGRKRSLCGLGDSVSDNEDDAENVRAVSLKHVPRVADTGTENEEDEEDDRIPISQVVQKMRGKRGSRDDDELGEVNGCSTFTTRGSSQLVKAKVKRARVARCGLDFVEPEEYMESEEDSEESNSMDEFIDDEGCSENCSEESAEPEESDSEVNYKDVMACIGRRRNANTKDWQYEAEMLSAFPKQPELCFKAVCALYRKQTEDEQSVKASMVQNRQGFSKLDAVRGSRIAEFLLDGDALGPPKKTVHDLEKYDPDALEFCEKMAAHYSKQLFLIYQNKEDPHFP
ncbi:unnamed protein product [Alopecurus aequalis]